MSELEALVKETKKHPAAFCECGLFAKWVGEYYYYNGEFDCYSYTVDCKRCGIVTVECV